LCPPRRRRREGVSQSRGKGKKICVPLKGGKGPPWRVGGSHTGQPAADGVARTVGVKTHPPAIRLVPLPFQGRTKEFPFPRDQAVSVRHSRRGKDKELCPPERGKGPALAGRGLAHRTTGSRRCYSYGRCKNPSTSHKAGPPSLFPGTRPFLFVTAVAGRTKNCVPLKGGKGPPWRVGGSHTGQTRADGVARTVGVKTHPPAIRLVPLPFQGRTKDFPFPRD
jgi:hypothetical protein